MMRCVLLVVGLIVLSALADACTPSEGNNLDKMTKARITIKDHSFEVWVAAEEETQAKGLMFVSSDRLDDLPDGTHRGMLFIFDIERPLSFWMKNTIAALDIAYINSKGTIVRRDTMKPLDKRSYFSGRPAKYALEVKANLLTELGIRTGDHVEIPDSVLKGDD